MSSTGKSFVSVKAQSVRMAPSQAQCCPHSEEVHFREAAKAHGLVSTRVTQPCLQGGPASCHRHLRTVPKRFTSCSLWPCAATRDCAVRVAQGSGPHSKAGASGRVIEREETLCCLEICGTPCSVPRWCYRRLATREAQVRRSNLILHCFCGLQTMAG